MNWLLAIRNREFRTDQFCMVKAKHILLVDDNDIDNFLAEHLFRLHEAAERITARRSAVEALKYLQKCIDKHREDFPDVIILDINMPQMDGFHFLDHYAKFPEELTDRCSIVMLTSSEAKEDSDRAHKNPYVDRFLQKPITDHTMEEILG
jgi:CheY-like chemotaxis protein